VLRPEAISCRCYNCTVHHATIVPMLTIDREIDARGLNCPLPILRTKKALNDMASGQTIRITATDPGSVRDFESFARQTGNALLEHGESDGAFWFVLKRR
jgi:tRNA 2-thiouridine synthesizing protein A